MFDPIPLLISESRFGDDPIPALTFSSIFVRSIFPVLVFFFRFLKVFGGYYVFKIVGVSLES